MRKIKPYLGRNVLEHMNFMDLTFLSLSSTLTRVFNVRGTAGSV